MAVGGRGREGGQKVLLEDQFPGALVLGVSERSGGEDDGGSEVLK